MYVMTGGGWGERNSDERQKGNGRGEERNDRSPFRGREGYCGRGVKDVGRGLSGGVGEIKGLQNGKLGKRLGASERRRYRRGIVGKGIIERIQGVCCVR